MMNRWIGVSCVLGSLLAGCGTSTLSLVVVRPAVVNARPHGGTVSVAGFSALRPDLTDAAYALRNDLTREVREGVGGEIGRAHD